MTAGLLVLALAESTCATLAGRPAVGAVRIRSTLLGSEQREADPSSAS